MKNNFIKIINNSLVWAIFIFLTASFFRIFFLNLIEFKADEAYAMYLINNLFLNPHLAPYSAFSSTGLHNMPFSLYFLTFLSIPVRDPQYLSFTIAFINSIFVVVFYLVIKRLYGNMTGIFTGFLLSLSPWSILFSRKIWSPDLMLYFLIPLYYFLHKLIVKKETKKTLPVFILLTLLPQVHFSGVYFFVATIIIFLTLKIKIDYKYASFGLLIGLIPAFPYIFYNLFSSPFCPECLAFFKYQGTPKFFDFNIFLRPFQILNGSYFDNPLGKDYGLFLNTFPFIKLFNYIFYLEFLLPVIGIVLIYKYKKNYLFLVFYLILVPLFYFLTKTPSYMYYYVIIIPIIILLSALSFKISFDLFKKPIYKYLIVLIFSLVIIINFIFEFSFYKFLSQRQTINGDYGPIFSKTKEFVDKEINSYLLLPYFDELKIYAYFYAHPKILHQRLGFFFMQKTNADLAIEEFKKALIINQKDVFSRSNLTYIYILNNKKGEAKEQIKILEDIDSSTAAKLKEMIK